MKGIVKHEARILAKVIRVDGTIEDYGVVAGPVIQVWWSKLKRMVNKLWQQ
jgi:hypothetical protein